MSNFRTLFERWPDRRALAEDLGVSLHAVNKWHERGSMPARHDLRLIEAAGARGIALSAVEVMQARAGTPGAGVSSGGAAAGGPGGG